MEIFEILLNHLKKLCCCNSATNDDVGFNEITNREDVVTSSTRSSTRSRRNEENYFYNINQIPIENSRGRVSSSSFRLPNNNYNTQITFSDSGPTRKPHGAAIQGVLKKPQFQNDPFGRFGTYNLESGASTLSKAHSIKTVQKDLILFEDVSLSPRNIDHSQDENDLADSSASFYRDEAQKLYNRRLHFYKQAKLSLRVNNRLQAKMYFDKAKAMTKLIEEANSNAAAAFLVENQCKHQGKSSCIDLHYLYVKEAIQALDIFLDEQITLLQDENLDKKTVTVITGRGKHSPNGIPKIKLAVQERLRRRKLKYFEQNPGCLMVRLFHDSYFSNEL